MILLAPASLQPSAITINRSFYQLIRNDLAYWLAFLFNYFNLSNKARTNKPVARPIAPRPQIAQEVPGTTLAIF